MRTKPQPARQAQPADMQSPWVWARSVRSHPFLYRKMVRELDPAARPGDVVQVYDREGRLFARGLFNPRSQIVVRLLADVDTPIDDAFWRARLQQALELRRRLQLDEVTDAYRLVHAEGDGLSGLVVERFADTLVFEVFALGMWQRREQIAAVLRELLPAPTALDRPQQAAAAWRTVVLADARAAELEGFRPPPPTPETPARLTVREHGVRYRVDFAAGHKTGFFCDQRDNRRRFAELCRDACVLDAFCYSGGFGLCAKLAGGAREVTSVDLDDKALALARENANLNQARIAHVQADAFSYLRQMIANGRQYDAVVLDPPKFALTRRDLEDARAKYHDLNKLGVQVVRPGGVLLSCSCSGLVSAESFLETVHVAARRVGRRLQLLAQTGAAADHPVLLDCPETAYLKALWLRVL